MRVTLKLATSLDGRIATASGESRWITGPSAREQVHRLRARHAAIAVGVETVLADNPALNVRLEDFVGTQPARIVFDSRLRTPSGSILVSTARQVLTIIFTTGPSTASLTDAGVEVISTPQEEGRVSIRAALDVLESRQALSTLMIEGGGQLAASFLAHDLVDEIHWFRAPIVLGADGRPGVGALSLVRLGDAPRFHRVSVEQVGDDLWERYVRT